MFTRCEQAKRFCRGQYDSPTHRSVAQKLAQPGGNPSALGSYLLRLSLLSRDARRKSFDRISDRFSYADPDLHAAEFGGDWMDHPELLGLPRHRASGDFSAGAAAWPGCAWRTSNFFTHERETRNRS